MDGIVVVVLTNCHPRNTLDRTISSADAMVKGPIERRVVVADGCNPKVPGWDVVTVEAGGFTRATDAALRVAVSSGQEWVFYSEDDFTFNRPVDLGHMQTLMDENPQMAQLSLLRQAWYEREKKAGGLIEAYGDWQASFVQRDGWIEHQAYWTTNPALMRRSFLASHPWPLVPNSEPVFGSTLFSSEPGTVAGILGAVGDPPLVTHIGAERAGSGY